MLGDGARRRALFERECSLQRRRQKVWEEAPAAGLPTPRARGAVRLGGAAGASGRAIAAPARSNTSTTTRRGEFFFIEMNTRIQVEHPVTEMVTGIDLVREMLRIAGGEPLRLHAGRHRAARPRHRVPHQRRGPGRRTSARRRARVGALARARRARRALRHAALSRLHGAAVLRLAARQADRLGRDRARARWRGCAARSASCRSRASPPRRRCTRRWPRDPEVAGRPRSTPRWLEALARDPRARTGNIEQDGRTRMMTTRYSFGGDEHIFVEIDEEMSLEAFFKSLSLTSAVQAEPASRA